MLSTERQFLETLRRDLTALQENVNLVERALCNVLVIDAPIADIVERVDDRLLAIVRVDTYLAGVRAAEAPVPPLRILVDYDHVAEMASEVGNE